MYEYEYGERDYDYDKHDRYKRKKCSAETHTISGSSTNLTGNTPIRIPIPANANVTVFEDFTNNHNKTILQLTSVSGTSGVPTASALSAVPLEVTIRTRGSRTPIEAIIPGGDDVIGGTRIFQVENFESLSVSNPNNVPGALNVFIQKTFCICCENNRNKCDLE
ncbi:exosporium protein D [Priestia endophytica]|uniref:exosporium protein D n=1 Tax=Priestia endophytica TaxID=135735 RepID=UPI003D2B327B